MTKRFIGTDANGKVLHGKPNLALVAVMMAQGGLVEKDNVEREIEKHVKAGIPEPVARSFIMGIAFGRLSEDEAVARIAAKDMPAGSTGVRVVDFEGLPADKAFFEAWEDDGATVRVNMTKARAIHAGRLAKVLDTEIRRLKVEESKERINGNTAKADAHAAVVLELEDYDLLATQVANAVTPESLSEVWPAKVPR